jgi:hypothetical protein
VNAVREEVGGDQIDPTLEELSRGGRERGIPQPAGDPAGGIAEKTRCEQPTPTPQGPFGDGLLTTGVAMGCPGERGIDAIRSYPARRRQDRAYRRAPPPQDRGLERACLPIAEQDPDDGYILVAPAALEIADPFATPHLMALGAGSGVTPTAPNPRFVDQSGNIVSSTRDHCRVVGEV